MQSTSVVQDLELLISRYWDGTLTDSELTALELRLSTDPQARVLLLDWSRQAIHAAECQDILTAQPPIATTVAQSRFQLDRRKLLIGFGTGTAFGLIAGAFFVRWWSTNLAQASASKLPVHLLWSQGTVVVRDAGGQALSSQEPLPCGGTIETIGTQSSAMLGFGRGSTVCLSAETRVVRSELGEVLTLEHGGLAADLYPAAHTDESLTVASSQLNIVMSGRSEVCLSQSSGSTDLSVQQGLAMVVTGDQPQPVTVYTGELVSVSRQQETTIQPVPYIPDRYLLDFTQPLPQGWSVGERVQRFGYGYVAAKRWYDPYHKAKLFQIRSQHAYTRGLVRIYPDSLLEVDYHAARAGLAQFVICVRSIPSTRRTTGNLDWTGQVEECTGQAWKTLKLRGEDFLHHQQPPSVGPPWVAFLMIFNTYDADLGFHVAQIRVSRPGPMKG